MEFEKELAGVSIIRDSLITVGVFDGVHLGHKYLISQLKKLAGQQGLYPIAITFHKHPQEVLMPGSQPPFLTDADEKAYLLKQEGIECVIVLTFTQELSRVDAADFIDILQTRLRMKGLVVGPDFALGRNTEGNISYLQKLGKEKGFTVTVIPPVRSNGDIISSTAIRRSLAAGDMEKVHRFLGRPFSLHGNVVHGAGRGTGLGFPTVNLNILPGQAIPSDGVYATLAITDNRRYASVTNIGMNPTFDAARRTIETYLLDFRDNLYDREIKIDFVLKIRDEVKFSNAEELSRQIFKDIKQTRTILDKYRDQQANKNAGV